jgi:sulfite reductase (ferredoxin)
MRLRSALRLLVQRHRPRVRLTPNQDLLLCDLPAEALPDIESALRNHGVPLPGQLSPARQYGLACPAIPTCGLALSESERVFPALIDELDAALNRLGLAGERIGVRMTGCPNGCVRPYQSDIGIVGRSGDKYTLFVGGNVLGTRLNFLLKDLVPLAEIVSTLRPLLEHFRDQRRPKESFGDYCYRIGADAARSLVGAPAPHSPNGQQHDGCD